MADRISGTIQVGGKVTSSQLEEMEKLGCLEEEFCDGSVCFSEARHDDFDDLINYCCKNNIALMIQWDAKYEYNGCVEYWVGGQKIGAWNATQTGDIYVTVSELHEKKGLTVEKFIESLGIPDFPAYKLIQYWVEYGNGERRGPYELRSDAESDADATDGIVIEVENV